MRAVRRIEFGEYMDEKEGGQRYKEKCACALEHKMMA